MPRKTKHKKLMLKLSEIVVMLEKFNEHLPTKELKSQLEKEIQDLKLYIYEETLHKSAQYAHLRVQKRLLRKQPCYVPSVPNKHAYSRVHEECKTCPLLKRADKKNEGNVMRCFYKSCTKEDYIKVAEKNNIPVEYVEIKY